MQFKLMLVLIFGRLFFDEVKLNDVYNNIESYLIFSALSDVFSIPSIAICSSNKLKMKSFCPTQ